MHVAIAAIALLADATPTPSPTTPPASEVTPGPWGFAAVVFVGVIVAFLAWDLIRRIRRVRYREQVSEELDAEQSAERSASRSEPGAGSGGDGGADDDDDGSR